LAQWMSSVIHYLPCFREWLITHPLSVFTTILYLFKYGSALKLPPCPSLFLWCSFSLPPVSSTVRVWLQFTVCFPVLFWGDQSALGLCWFMFLGVYRLFPHGTWCLHVYSVN
jgi:hypothetical protein